MTFLKKIILLLKYKLLTYQLRKLPKVTAKMWRVVVRAVEQGAGTDKSDIDTNKALMREVVTTVYGKKIDKRLLLPAYLKCARHVMNEVNRAGEKLETQGEKKHDLSAYYTIKHFNLQLIRAFSWTESTIDGMYIDDLFDLMVVANETAEKSEDEREAYIDEIL